MHVSLRLPRFAATRRECITRSLTPLPAIYYLHVQLSGAGSVELAEVDSLPGAEHKPPVFDEYEHVVADEARLDVAVAVPLVMSVIRLVLRHQRFQLAEHVALDVRVGVLVDRDR